MGSCVFLDCFKTNRMTYQTKVYPQLSWTQRAIAFSSKIPELSRFQSTRTLHFEKPPSLESSILTSKCCTCWLINVDHLRFILLIAPLASVIASHPTHWYIKCLSLGLGSSKDWGTHIKNSCIMLHQLNKFDEKNDQNNHWILWLSHHVMFRGLPFWHISFKPFMYVDDQPAQSLTSYCNRQPGNEI